MIWVVPMPIRLNVWIVGHTRHVWVWRIGLVLGLKGVSIGISPPILIPRSVFLLRIKPRRVIWMETPRFILTIVLKTRILKHVLIWVSPRGFLVCL